MAMRIGFTSPNLGLSLKCYNYDEWADDKVFPSPKLGLSLKLKVSYMILYYLIGFRPLN